MTATQSPTVTFRPTTRDDAAELFRLVEDDGVLDLNSPYFYVLFADEYADTCVVAERDGELAGFVVGLHPPRRPEVIFVWQVGVSPRHRRLGIAGCMLDELARRTGATALEATVTPDNAASEALFRGFARRHGAACTVEADHYPSELFGIADHETERLFHIEPIPSASAPGDADPAREDTTS